MDRATDTRTKCKSLKSLRAGKWYFFQVVLVGNNSMHSRSVHNQMVEPGATALFIDGQFACQCGAGQPSPESGQPLTAYAGAGHHAGVSTNATVKDGFCVCGERAFTVRTGQFCVVESSVRAKPSEGTPCGHVYQDARVLRTTIMRETSICLTLISHAKIGKRRSDAFFVSLRSILNSCFLLGHRGKVAMFSTQRRQVLLKGVAPSWHR